MTPKFLLCRERGILVELYGANQENVVEGSIDDTLIPSLHAWPHFIVVFPVRVLFSAVCTFSIIL